MAYQLGRKFKLNATKGIVIRNCGPIGGFRAFARDEADGLYREALAIKRELAGEYVDGEFQGSSIVCTADTRDEALSLANRAYRWINGEGRSDRVSKAA